MRKTLFISILSVSLMLPASLAPVSAHAAPVPAVRWGSSFYHAAMKFPGQIGRVVLGLGGVGVVKAIEFTDEMLRFYMAVSVMEYTKCAFSGDPIPCRSFLESMKDPYHIMGFYMFVLVARGASVGMHYIASKGFYTGVGGHLPMVAGMFGDHVFTDIAHHEAWDRYQAASKIEDERLRKAERDRAFWEVFETFKKSEWWREQMPNIGSMVLAAIGSGYVTRSILPRLTHSMWARGRAADILYQAAGQSGWTARMASLSRRYGRLGSRFLRNSRLFELRKAKFFIVNGKFAVTNWIVTFAVALASTDVFLWMVEKLGEPIKQWDDGQRALNTLTDKMRELDTYLRFMQGKDPKDWHPARKKAVKRLIKEVHWSWQVYRSMLMSKVYQQQMLVNAELGLLSDQMIKLQNFYEWISRGMDREDPRYIENQMGWHADDAEYNLETLIDRLKSAGGDEEDPFKTQIEKDIENGKAGKVETLDAGQAYAYDPQHMKEAESRVLQNLYVADQEIHKTEPDLGLMKVMGHEIDRGRVDYFNAGGVDLFHGKKGREINEKMKRVSNFLKEHFPEEYGDRLDPVGQLREEELRRFLQKALAPLSEEERNKAPVWFDSDQLTDFPSKSLAQVQTYEKLRSFFCGAAAEAAFTPSQDWGGIPMRAWDTGIEYPEFMKGLLGKTVRIPYWPFGTHAKMEDFRLFEGIEESFCDGHFRAHSSGPPMGKTPRQLEIYQRQAWPAADKARKKALTAAIELGALRGRPENFVPKAFAATDIFRTELIQWHEERMTDEAVSALTGMETQDVEDRYTSYQLEDFFVQDSLKEQLDRLDQEFEENAKKVESGEITLDEMFELDKEVKKRRETLIKQRPEWKFTFSPERAPELKVFGWSLLRRPDLDPNFDGQKLSSHHQHVLGSLAQERYFWMEIKDRIPPELNEYILQQVSGEEFKAYGMLRYLLTDSKVRAHREGLDDTTPDTESERIEHWREAYIDLNKMFQWTRK